MSPAVASLLVTLALAGPAARAGARRSVPDGSEASNAARARMGLLPRKPSRPATRTTRRTLPAMAFQPRGTGEPDAERRPDPPDETPGQESGAGIGGAQPVALVAAPRVIPEQPVAPVDAEPLVEIVSVPLPPPPVIVGDVPVSPREAPPSGPDAVAPPPSAPEEVGPPRAEPVAADGSVQGEVAGLRAAVHDVPDEIP